MKSRVKEIVEHAHALKDTQKKQMLFLGNEAIARGALKAGVAGQDFCIFISNLQEPC